VGTPPVGNASNCFGFAIDGGKVEKEEFSMSRLAFILAATVALASNASLAFGDTVTTTTIERTSGGPEFLLPAGNSYVAVNTSGTILGPFDYTTRLLNGAPLPLGSYVIEKTSGKVFATVDANGNIIALTTPPPVLPEHFIVRSGAIFFLGSDYSARRAQLEAQINSDFASGHLSNNDVKELREKLQEIQSLEMKRRADGTYKSSTANEIERKFARLQSDYSEDIANINEKRSKIGIQNN
jgi:hypothetical protein